MIKSAEVLLVASALIYLVLSKDLKGSTSSRFAPSFIHQKSNQADRSSEGKLIRGSKGRFSFKRSLISAIDDEASIIVFGPTRSGKTRNVAVPIIKSTEGSLVVTSVKDDLVKLTYPSRADCSRVYFLGRSPTPGEPCYFWDPVGEVSDFLSAKVVAENLVSHAPGNLQGSSDTRFWYQLSSRLLAPVLLAAKYQGVGTKGVISWLDSASFQEPYEILMGHREDQAAQTIDSVRYWDEKQLSSVLITILSVAHSVELALPSILDQSRCLVLGDLFRPSSGTFTLYMTSNFSNQRRLAPYFGALNSTLASLALSDRNGDARLTGAGITGARLTIVLDEAANTAPMTELAELASLGQGLGVRLVTILQDVSQLKNAYSIAANTVVNNHRTKLFLPGISDPETVSLAVSLISTAPAPTFEFSVRTLSNRSALLIQANSIAELVKFNARRRYFFG